MIYDLFNKMRGSAAFTVTGAFPEGLLSRCAAEGIELLSAVPVDDWTLRVTVPHSQAKRFRAAAARSLCEVGEGETGGEAAWRRKLLRRAFPAALLFALLVLLAWSNFYIWDIEVTGGGAVPPGRVLDVLEQCGVGIGSYWPAFNSDSIRSEALLKLPELSWLTVNVYGSRAVVVVRDRVEVPEMIDKNEPWDIYAAKDGFVTKVTALSGAEQTAPGRAAVKGELLISGAVENAMGGVRLTHALGSVTARTWYELTAVQPSQAAVKTASGREKSRWSLTVGARRINFYRNSSICDTGCDKIYTEYKLGIRGLFSLPVKLVRETSRFYSTAAASGGAYYDEALLKSTLHERLLGELGAGGTVLSETYTPSESGGAHILCLRSECEENIARPVKMDAARLSGIEQSKTLKGTQTK